MYMSTCDTLTMNNFICTTSFTFVCVCTDTGTKIFLADFVTVLILIKNIPIS